jgi:hypothetical protein
MYITTEASLNFPLPDPRQLAAQLWRMSPSQRPVTVAAIAQVYDVPTGAIASILRQAERLGIVREVQGMGWISLRT